MLIGEMAFMASFSVVGSGRGWRGRLSWAAHMGMTSQLDQSLCAAAAPDAKMADGTPGPPHHFQTEGRQAAWPEASTR
jgi:hypothetical protein